MVKIYTIDMIDNNNTSNTNSASENQNKNQGQQTKAHDPNAQKRTMMHIIIALSAVVVVLGVWFAITTISQQKALNEAIALKEQAELDADQRDLENAYEELNEQFAAFENQRELIVDDSVKRDLAAKYENARLQVEKLQEELRNQKNKSSEEIRKLKEEISTLRDLLRHYVEEINRLNIENQNLRDENAKIKDRNQRLTTRVEETAKKNEELSQRMTLAERLNVTGLSLEALNKKGKTEKKVRKAKQLKVTFTIPQNNSTPVGAKTIYLRLTSPSGQLLGNGGTFEFEDGQVQCSAKTVIEYTGEEINDLIIYWDVDTALTAGEYTVELFADNFRLISRKFELK